MITFLLSCLLFLVFCILSAFHFFWLFGGTWGLKYVIPTPSIKTSSQAIPKFATLLVALVLQAFGLVYLKKTGISDLKINIPVFIYWGIPIIFIIRVIGDFKYLGIFKKIKNTAFSKSDTKLFIPLCIGIAVSGILIQMLN